METNEQPKPAVPKREPLQKQCVTIAEQLEECATSLEKEPLALPAHGRIVRNGAAALRLAGEAIEQLRKDHAAEIRELTRDARAEATDAYHEGRAAGSEEGSRW